MPIYRVQHQCGYLNEFFLNTDKDSVLTRCLRCKLQVSARQVRDKRAIIKTKHEVTGVFTDDGNKT